MTKKQISEIVIMQLCGGVPQRGSKFSDPRFVYAIMDTVRDSLVYKYLMPQIYNDKYLNTTYVFTYPNVTVNDDLGQDRRYSDLPVKVITLPKDSHIEQIAYTQDNSMSFVRVDSTTEWLFKNNEAKGLQNNIGYYPDKSRVYYYRLNPMVKSVLMRLVTAGESIGENEFYVGVELMDAVIAETMKLMSPMGKPQDMSNNNVDG